MLEQEAPVRAAAFRLQRGAFVRRQFQRGAVIDGRQTRALLPLAAAVELVFRLVAGVEPAGLAFNFSTAAS